MWRKREVDLNVPLIFARSRNVKDFPGGSDGKESACKAGDLGSGRSPGEGNDNPLQYSCLENSMDRRAWQAPLFMRLSRQEY